MSCFRFVLLKPWGHWSVQCAPIFMAVLEKINEKLQKYCDKTNLVFVYTDAMILNPRYKLSIFSERTWSDIDSTPYTDGCRCPFETEYKSDGTVATTASHGQKRLASDDIDDDDEFQALLARRAAKRSCTDAFQCYMSIPNDPCIPSALAYWKVHQTSFPDLTKMVRDTLAVPPSGCSWKGCLVFLGVLLLGSVPAF